MNEDIIIELTNELNITKKQIMSVLKLLSEDNTIAFIARYRKELTGGLDEEQIRAIELKYNYQVSLEKRKEDIVRLIDEKGLLTEDIKSKISRCTKLVELEDIYRPFKEKKKTKATEAIKLGLEPLAKKIMSFPTSGSLELLVKPYLNKDIDKDRAITLASYIIAEFISDNAYYRKWIRNYTYKHGIIRSSKSKNACDDDKLYDMYYDYNESVKSIKPHRILAINRGEKEKILSVSLDINNEEIIDFLNKKVIRNDHSFVRDIVLSAIVDSYKRLIKPSIEREIRSQLTDMASDVAIDNFGQNLENLLMQPPIKDKVVLALDPAYRTGCKLAVLDSTGKLLDISVIYPHEPVNKKIEAKNKVIELINKYKVDVIAIGNGTASRESEQFIVEVIKEVSRPVVYVMVSEAGASIYSASKLAIEEFPELTVEKRSAVSIGRRLQDPLAELVKIDPESIGVGMYQHDLPHKKLVDSLDFIVTTAVNKVGVNINTASSFLLKYVSGLNKRSIDKLINYRNSNGKFMNRDELRKLLSPKAYEQAIGFLRISDGSNPLDETGIHPESYSITTNLLSMLNLSTQDISTSHLIEVLEKIDVNEYIDKLHTDKYTLEDIIKSLENPLRDPRDDMPKPILRSDVLHIEDLNVGMKLKGTVRNVIDFGAFIDIGLKNDALAHISKLTDKYIKHPSEVVSVGDVVDCYVDEVNLDKNKVSLSLIDIAK